MSKELNETLGGLIILPGMWMNPPTHIPVGDGSKKSYKTELRVSGSPERTEKFIWWHDDDPRGKPHNHPWESFESTILSGGYTDHRWTLHNGGSITYEYLILVKDQVNTVPNNVFHLVTDVLPGTVTHLICGKSAPDNEWGYLDLNNSSYEKAVKTEEYFNQMVEINPHLKK
jgi:hypothetical protein